MNEKLGNSSEGLKKNQPDMTANTHGCPTTCKSSGTSHCSKPLERNSSNDSEDKGSY